MRHDHDHDPNRRYREDPDPERWAAHLEREDREVWANRELILEAAQLRAGQTVIDVGAGTGAFSRLLAERVGPRGSVLAVEPMPEFREHLGARGVGNLSIVPRLSEVPDAAADAAVCIDTLHHVADPEGEMRELLRALRSGGSLLLVDLHRGPDSPEWVREHVRLSRGQVEEALRAAGFGRLAQVAELGHNYVLRAAVP